MSFQCNKEDAPRVDIATLKERLPLPTLLETLGLGEHARKLAFCPLHENTKTPSFSTWQGARGWKWKCNSNCGSGDEIDFIEKIEGLSKGAALRRYAELAESASLPLPAHRPTRGQAQPAAEPALPGDLHKGNREELQTVATLRGVDLMAVAAMSDLGVIAFGTVCGRECWILGDKSQRAFQARRMDGRSFQSYGGNPERKTHNLKGSKIEHLVGLRLRPCDPIEGVEACGNRAKLFRKFLLVEGSGDYVAGFHFALRGSGALLPVMALGAGVTLDAEALGMMAGEKVIIVPHIDENGAGEKAAVGWAAALKGVGCTVRVVHLAGRTQSNGDSVRDLNDCVRMSAEEIEHLMEEFK